MNPHSDGVDSWLQCESPDQLGRLVLLKVADQLVSVATEDGVYSLRINAAAHKNSLPRMRAARTKITITEGRRKAASLWRSTQRQPPITANEVTGIKADYKKDRVQVEVQFGNMARWYTDVFKFQVSYSLDLIDVGVLVIPMQDFAATIDENVAYYERVMRELPYAKMSITLPIWVVGVRP